MRKYLLCLSFGICASTISAMAGMSGQGVYDLSAEYILRMLSDAFLLPAVLFIGIGWMVFASDRGFFDLFRFAVRSIITKDGTKYSEYVSGKRKEKKTPVPMLVVGTGFLAVSLLFCVLYSFPG